MLIGLRSTGPRKLKCPLRPVMTKTRPLLTLGTRKVPAPPSCDQKKATPHPRDHKKCPLLTLGTRKMSAAHPWDQKSVCPSPLGPEKCLSLTLGTRKMSAPHPWDQKSVCPSPLGPEKCLPLTLGTRKVPARPSASLLSRHLFVVPATYKALDFKTFSISGHPS